MLLLLLNISKLSEGLLKNLFSVDKEYDKSFNEESKKLIKNFHKKNDEILEVYNEIKKLEEDYLNCSNCIEDKDKCGNMIMQYFLYDTIQIEDENVNSKLYGGFK